MNRIFLIVGPSGSGKTTLVKDLLHEFPEASEVISTTTREPRVGEVEGRDYFFISHDAFYKNKLYGAFAESVEFAGNAYGIYKSEIQGKLENGPVFIIVEPEGAKQIQNAYPEDWQVVTIYLEPPTAEERLGRLHARGDFDGFDTSEEVAAQVTRRQTADAKITLFKDKADHQVVSTTKYATFCVAAAIITHEMMVSKAA